MNFCSQCGSQRVPEAKFCANCGERFAFAPAASSVSAVETAATVLPEPQASAVTDPASTVVAAESPKPSLGTDKASAGFSGDRGNGLGYSNKSGGFQGS